MADPNWLLSTTAQSAAAIVAIMGGFLISRLVALSAERNAAESKRQEMEAELRSKQDEIDRRQGYLNEEDAKEYLSKVVGDIALRSGDLTLEDLVQNHPDEAPIPPERLRPYFDQAVAMIKEAVGHIDNAVGSKPPPWPEFETLLAGRRLEEWERELWKATYAALKESRKKKLPEHIFGISKLVNVPRFPVELLRPSAWRTREYEKLATLRMDVRILRGQVAQLRTEEGRRVNPRDLWWAFGVLSYFGLAGIVVPVVLMPRGTLSDPTRRLVIGLFVSGLAAVLGYVSVAIVALTRRPQADGAQDVPSD